MKGLFLLLLLSALLGAVLFYWLSKILLKRKLKKRFDRANLGEYQALDLLKKWGYELLDTQKSSWLSMWIDDVEHTYLVRPDAYAKKNEKTYLVEIKTGPQATNPKLSATRRQLLEYYYGFSEVEGILLINADLKKVIRVSFDPPATQEIQSSREESQHV